MIIILPSQGGTLRRGRTWISQGYTQSALEFIQPSPVSRKENIGWLASHSRTALSSFEPPPSKIISGPQRTHCSSTVITPKIFLADLEGLHIFSLDYPLATMHCRSPSSKAVSCCPFKDPCQRHLVKWLSSLYLSDNRLFLQGWLGKYSPHGLQLPFSSCFFLTLEEIFWRMDWGPLLDYQIHRVNAFDEFVH